jgi:hypothetical protein
VGGLGYKPELPSGRSSLTELALAFKPEPQNYTAHTGRSEGREVKGSCAAEVLSSSWNSIHTQVGSTLYSTL